MLPDLLPVSYTHLDVYKRQGLVSVNYEQAESVKLQLKSGDVFSIRGYGKYVLENDIRVTKKERLYVNIKKYL